MGILGFLRKNKGNPQKVEIEPSSNEKQFKAQSKDAVSENNYLKDNAGLYPHELLLLTYYEKYAAGKQIARFWKYEFDVNDVPALMRSLEIRGFANGNSLTDSGREEAKKAEYILYLRKNKYIPISLFDLSVLVNKNPDRNYKDLIWGKLNQNAVQYASEGKWGLYCNVQYALYRITVQEGKYKEAFKCLAITVFYTLNNGDIYPMPPGLIDDIRKLSIKLNTTDELMIDDLKRLYKGMYAPSRNFSNDEVTLIFTAYAFGYDEMAENTINRKLES